MISDTLMTENVISKVLELSCKISVEETGIEPA